MLHHDARGRGRTKVRRRSEAGAGARRLAWGALLATSAAVCVVPVGCASSDEHPASPQQGTEPSLSASTVAALQACADEGAGRLERHAYEIGFEVEVTADGEVRAVKPKGKRLDDASVERCMMNALRATPPGFAPDSASDPLISRRVPGHARGVLGSVTVLPVVVELTAVLATVSGVTIVVMIGVVVVAAAVASSDAGPSEEECKKDWERALAKCDEWLSKPNPPSGLTGGYKDRYNCAKGHVMEGCEGANEIDWGSKGRPGRRY